MRRSCSGGFRSKSSIKRVLFAHGARHPNPRDGVAVDQVLIDGPMCHADEKLMTLADRLPDGACLGHLFDPLFNCLLGDVTDSPIAPLGSTQFWACERRWAIVLRASPTDTDRYPSITSRIGVLGDSARP